MLEAGTSVILLVTIFSASVLLAFLATYVGFDTLAAKTLGWADAVFIAIITLLAPKVPGRKDTDKTNDKE